VLPTVLVAAGFLIGMVVGRWWALLVAAGAGVWVALIDETVLDGWFVGGLWASFAAVGICAGILARRLVTRARRSQAGR
jgi:hypothetical protein